MKTIPLLPAGSGIALPDARSLVCDRAGVWHIAGACGEQVRPLNAYEARFVNSTIAACGAREAQGCAQVRRDLVAAREATARLMTQWREALGASQGDDLEAATLQMATMSKARFYLGRTHRERLAQLERAEVERACEAGFDQWANGYANGLRIAVALMRGVEGVSPLPPPLVWGRDAGTLRGRYRLARGRRASILGAACEALVGWLS